MAIRKRCIFNWSGGKDSTLALHYALEDPSIEIKYLVTTVTEKYNRVSMHGVREALLIKQAESIGIELYQIRLPEMPDMDTYDEVMRQHLAKFKAEGITHSIFGDIFLEDLRTYRENKLEEVGLKAIFPLWKKDTRQLIDEFINLNYKTIIVCAQQSLKSICGKIIDNDLINELPAEIDPCGENGEFHTFAFEGPVFKVKVVFQQGETVFRTYKKPSIEGDTDNSNFGKEIETGFWYIDLF
ncbi:diphthine--ammonia ligase [Pedobacter sp. Leaf176]|uniref:Dph6-related ATP pyrophosphatase n=1 Tax=Pedobacter sp. Leaf176 TaxID=1736286 RepID=UPI0006F481FD|nr:diphthine--ammonia ligase [Pedobacter sp. Leaf176]KQR67310.1 ATP-binding protein [Pedobacter sp. Leaf176]